MRTLIQRRLTGGLFALLLLGGASRADAAPYFEEVPNALGMQACNGGGCWTNYLRVSDIDGDKDLDIILVNATGFFKKGTAAQPLVIYRNDGTGKFENVSTTAVGDYSGYIRQVALGDVDNDGDLDMYVPSAWSDPDKFFINDGKGVFTDESATRLPGVKSHAGATRFGDVDNDGDLDLLVGDYWVEKVTVPLVAHLYLNDGAGVFTDATAQLPTMKAGQQPDDFDLVDADGDFDLDLLINMHVGTASLWLNDGKGTFANAAFPAQDAGPYKYGPAVCDVDGDNDLDIWFDNSGPNYTEQLFINDGAGKYTDETVARVTDNPSADDNGVACIDVDGDGDLDAAIMSLSDEERVLLNDGAGKFSPLPDAFTPAGDPTLWFEFGDLNGDGRLDVVTGQGEGQPELDRVYFGSMQAPVDATPPRLRAVEALADVALGEARPVRFAVSDNATTDEGPRLQKAYLKVTTVDSIDEVPATFMGGDLFRAVFPAQDKAGDVTYVACAVDAQGNEGCSDPKLVDVKDGGASSSSSGAGGAGGAEGVGGQSSSDGSTTSSTGAGTGGDTGGTGGEGGSRGPDLGDEGGCGCAVPGGETGAAGTAAGFFAALALLASRVRRVRRRGASGSARG